jgi:hypothetical protein
MSDVRCLRFDIRWNAAKNERVSRKKEKGDCRSRIADCGKEKQRRRKQTPNAEIAETGKLIRKPGIEEMGSLK